MRELVRRGISTDSEFEVVDLASDAGIFVAVGVAAILLTDLVARVVLVAKVGTFPADSIRQDVALKELDFNTDCGGS